MPTGIYIRTKEHNRKLGKVLSDWRKNGGFTSELMNRISLIKKGKHYSLNTEFKKGHSPWNKGIKCSEETKEKISKTLKEDYHPSNTQFKKGIIPWHKGKHLVHSGSFKKGHKGYCWSEEEKLLRSINSPRYWKGKKFSEEHKQKLREARRFVIAPKYDTSIETKIQNFLKLLNIEFYTHQYIKDIKHGYNCDILIPSTKTIIECDGDYWHGNPNKYPTPFKFQGEQIEEDRIRTNELIEKGFRVIRLWESDIKLMELDKFKEKLK